jgi:hypothetical protein
LVVDISEIHTSSFSIFVPEDGGSMYDRKVGNTPHIYTVRRHSGGINITNEPLAAESLKPIIQCSCSVNNEP